MGSKTERDHWFDLFLGSGEGEALLTLLSGSMADALLPGDALLVRSLRGKRPHIGDIVVFRDGGKLVAHRLLLAFRLLSFALLVEKGDANRSASIIAPEAIVGIVAGARRDGSSVFSRTPESVEAGRRASMRALLRHLTIQAPKNWVKRMLGRDA